MKSVEVVLETLSHVQVIGKGGPGDVRPISN